MEPGIENQSKFMNVGNIIDYSMLSNIELPPPILNYYRKIDDKPFIYQINKLRRDLIKYDNDLDRNKYYKHLFLAMIYFTLGQKYNCLTELEKIKEIKINEKLIQLEAYMVETLNYFKNTLIVTSLNYVRNNNYLKIREFSKSITVMMSISKFDIKKLLKSLAAFDQIFLIGHGKSDYIRIGSEKITEKVFTMHLANGGKLPQVLGILSCENLLKDKEIISKIPYYIVDDNVSASSWSEIFVYNYLKEYYFKTKAVQSAFVTGKASLLFRTNSDPGLSLYIHGKKM